MEGKEFDMNEIKNETVEKLIRDALKDGKLLCEAALRIAAEANVSPSVVGATANRLKIKIAGCQLGCFK